MFKGPWRPKKRLTRYQMEHLRTLRKEFPSHWTIDELSHHFGISYSAVKRILRSKFEPTEDITNRQDGVAKRQQLERIEKTKQQKVSDIIEDST